MNKDIDDIKTQLAELNSEVEKLIENLSDDASDDEIKEIDDKTEECKSLEAVIAKKQKVIDLKKSQKAIKAQKATEEVNTFNIISGNLSPELEKKLTDNKSLIGRKALNNFLIKSFGEVRSRNMIADGLGKAAADFVMKDALTSTNQPVVPQDMQGFVSLLTAESVVRPNARIIPTPNGNRTIPRMRLGSSATWQGEGQVYSPSTPDFDQINLSWYKLTGMTYTTLEFSNFSYIDLTNEITSNLANMLALTEDKTFLLGSTATYAPKTCLLNSAKHTFVSTGKDNIGIANDLANVKSQMETDFISIQGAVVFGAPAVFNALENLSTQLGVYPFRDEIRSGYLNGYKICKTAQIPTNNATGTGDTAATNGSPLIFAQPKHLIIGDSYQYQLRSTTDGGFVDNGAQVNTFGQDLIAWKLANAVDFAVEHPEAVCVLNTVGWTTLNIAGQYQAVSPANTSTTSASGAKGKSA